MMTIGHELAKWRHLVAKLGTYSSGAPWWPKLKLMQVLVAKFATNKLLKLWTQKHGSVVPLAICLINHSGEPTATKLSSLIISTEIQFHPIPFIHL